MAKGAEPVEVSKEIDAPPEVVWHLISDLPRMGEWSPEVTRVTWRGGASGPAVGARFKGTNKMGAAGMEAILVRLEAAAEAQPVR